MLMVPRNILTAMLRRARGEYTDAEARISVLLDLDKCGKARSQRDYAKQWGWTRGRVRQHIQEIVSDAESWLLPTQQQPNNNPTTTQKSSKTIPEEPIHNPTTTQQQPKKDPSLNGSFSPTPPLSPLSQPKEDSPKRKTPTGSKEKGSLPDWIDDGVWDAWKQFRNRQKKPLTERAVLLQVAKLDRWRKMGQDPNAIIDQSIENGWTGLYELKQAHGSKPRESLSERYERTLRAAQSTVAP